MHRLDVKYSEFLVRAAEQDGIAEIQAVSVKPVHQRADTIATPDKMMNIGANGGGRYIGCGIAQLYTKSLTREAYGFQPDFGGVQRAGGFQKKGRCFSRIGFGHSLLCIINNSLMKSRQGIGSIWLFIIDNLAVDRTQIAVDEGIARKGFRQVLDSLVYLFVRPFLQKIKQGIRMLLPSTNLRQSRVVEIIFVSSSVRPLLVKSSIR